MIFQQSPLHHETSYQLNSSMGEIDIYLHHYITKIKQSQFQYKLWRWGEIEILAMLSNYYEYGR